MLSGLWFVCLFGVDVDVVDDDDDDQKKEKRREEWQCGGPHTHSSIHLFSLLVFMTLQYFWGSTPSQWALLSGLKKCSSTYFIVSFSKAVSSTNTLSRFCLPKEKKEKERKRNSLDKAEHICCEKGQKVEHDVASVELMVVVVVPGFIHFGSSH